MPGPVPLRISPDAAQKLKTQADFSRSFLSIRHLLGCGGNGFRVSVEDGSPDEGHRFEVEGVAVVMDDYAFHRLAGAVLELDPDPQGEGFRLNHADAVVTTFC